MNDLSDTDVTEVGLSLARSLNNPKAGDGAGDHVVVNGTDGADTVQLTGTQPDGVTVSELPAVVRIFGTNGTSDALAFHALGGNDTPWTPPGWRQASPRSPSMVVPARTSSSEAPARC